MKLVALVIAAQGLVGCDDAFDLVHVARPDGGTSTTADATTLAPGLVAWLPMDALETTKTPELVSRHDGTCASCPTVTTGVRNKALRFDGVLQRIEVAAFPTLQTTTAFTVSAWLRPDAMTPSGSYECPLMKAYGLADSSWGICLNGSTGRIELAVSGNFLVADVPVPGLWMHVAAVWDGSALGWVVDDQSVSVALVPTVAFDTGPLLVGAEVSDGTVKNAFQGAIDDVRIYDRPLSLDEIRQL